jgi:formyl-CoA transferase
MANKTLLSETTSNAATAPARTSALQGVRVADLTQFEAGTSCTETLAWFGAEVIKVEEPTKGEPGRGAPSEPGVDSYYFMLLNANKQSVTANLKTEKGRALLRALIERSDVFVENFAPGTIERMGFGWDVVKEINPRIIYAQIKGFSPSGPFGTFRCFDMIAQAAGGAMSVTGELDGRPLRPGINIADSGAGMQCAMGIIAALYQREFTGVGQRVEVAMQEAVMSLGRTSFQAHARGVAAPRIGNREPSMSSPAEIYPCKGGGPNDYCYIVDSRKINKHWPSILKAMGREDALTDPRFATPALRWDNRADVDEFVSSWTRQHDKVDVMKMLGAAGVPAGAVFDTLELSRDPHLLERGAVVNVEHPVNGVVAIPGFPVRLSASHVPLSHSPILGADTDNVYTNILGLSAEDVSGLRRESVI